MENKTKVKPIRIPFGWIQKIERIAKEECRTFNSVVNQAIKEFLERK